MISISFESADVGRVTAEVGVVYAGQHHTRIYAGAAVKEAKVSADGINDTTGDNFDSLVFTLPQMVFLYQFEPGKHTLRVYALDTNYFDWVSAGGFGPGTNTGETTHLSGGIGVFGSGVGESVEVYVKTDTAFRQEAKSEFRNQSAEFRMPERGGRGEEAGLVAVRSRGRRLPRPAFLRWRAIPRP